MKKFTIFLLIVVIVLLLVACGNKDSISKSDNLVEEEKTTVQDSVDAALLGYYECSGCDLGGTKLEASGEWLELKDDGSGAWFLGATENAFKWTLEGNKINFDLEDVGLKYKATLDDKDIVLDTGMLYYFTKSDRLAKQSNDNKTDTIGIQPAGSIQIPSKWYGVAIIEDSFGFDYEGKFDVWGAIDIDSTGGTFFELYIEPAANPDNNALMSMYIDENEREWLTPIIGDEDSWLMGYYLKKEAEWDLLTMYDEGALDIYYTWDQGEDRYAECRFFIREYGTAWDEAVDPLPIGYAEYASKNNLPTTNVADTNELEVDIAINPSDIEFSFGSDDYGKDGWVYTSTGTMKMKIPEGWEVDIALHETTIGVRSPEDNSDIIRASAENYSSMIKNPADRTPENQAKESCPSSGTIVKDKWGNTDVWYFIYEWSDRTEIKGYAAYSDEEYLSFDIRVKEDNGTVEDFMKSDAWNTLKSTFEFKKP